MAIHYRVVGQHPKYGIIALDERTKNFIPRPFKIVRGEDGQPLIFYNHRAARQKAARLERGDDNI